MASSNQWLSFSNPSEIFPEETDKIIIMFAVTFTHPTVRNIMTWKNKLRRLKLSPHCQVMCVDHLQACIIIDNQSIIPIDGRREGQLKGYNIIIQCHLQYYE